MTSLREESITLKYVSLTIYLKPRSCSCHCSYELSQGLSVAHASDYRIGDMNVTCHLKRASHIICFTYHFIQSFELASLGPYVWFSVRLVLGCDVAR